MRSPFAGRIIETFSSEGDEINVGEPLFVIIPVDSEVAAATPAVAAVAPSTKAAVAPVPSSQPAQVKTAPANAPKPAAAAPKAAAAAAAPVKTANSAPVGVLGGRTETRVKMTRMRLRIAQRLKEAQNTTAMLTTFQVRTWCCFIIKFVMEIFSFGSEEQCIDLILEHKVSSRSLTLH